MKIRYSLCILMLCIALSSKAQNAVITCSTGQNSNRSISIYAESNAYGNYTM